MIELLATTIAGLSFGYVLALTLDAAYQEKSARAAPSRRRVILLTAAAASMAIMIWSLNSSPAEAAAMAGVGAVFLALVATDIERHLLPNRIMYPSIPTVLILAPWLPADTHLSAVVGAALGLGILLVPYLAVAGALGAGDVKLGALIGGFVGAGLLLPALMIGAITGAIASLVLLARSRTPRASIAYGPYLIVGALLAPLFYSG